jgi:hypothetical protein
LSLQSHTHRIVAESATARQAGDPDWWKPLEGLLALIGGIADDVRGLVEEDAEKGQTKSFDVQEVFDRVVPGLLDLTGESSIPVDVDRGDLACESPVVIDRVVDTPFLQGRAFVFASQFAALLPDALAGQFLGAAVHSLESPSVMITVKLSAVKTIKK